MTPPCFDSDKQYDEWYHASLDVSIRRLHRPTYCTDCLPEYQAKMHQQGRCTFPLTEFIHCGGPEAPGAFYGRRKKSPE